MKKFNNIKEIKKYYNKETNTYVFKEKGEHIDIELMFDLKIEANIEARNINAYNIDAHNIYASVIYADSIYAHNIYAYYINAGDIDAGDIDAGNISAWNINADNISFHAYCIAFNTLTCKSYKGRRNNHIIKCLDSQIKTKGESNDR